MRIEIMKSPWSCECFICFKEIEIGWQMGNKLPSIPPQTHAHNHSFFSSLQRHTHTHIFNYPRHCRRPCTVWPVNVHSGNSKRCHYIHYIKRRVLYHTVAMLPLSQCYKLLMRHYCAAEAAALVIYVSPVFMHGFICSLIWIHWEIKHMRRFGSSIIPLQHLPLIVMFFWQGICNTPQNKESYYEPKLINTEDWTSSKIIYRNDLFCSAKLMQKSLIQ